MTLLLVVLLVVLWGAVFVPAILRARQESSPILTVGTFRRGMRALGGRSSNSGRWVLMPVGPEQLLLSRRQMLIRRRRVFSGLVVTAGATLVFGLIPGARGLLKIHLAVDLILFGYIIFLIQAKQRRVSRPAQREPEEFAEPLARAGHF